MVSFPCVHFFDLAKFDKVHDDVRSVVVPEHPKMMLDKGKACWITFPNRSSNYSIPDRELPNRGVWCNRKAGCGSDLAFAFLHRPNTAWVILAGFNQIKIARTHLIR